MPGAKRLTRAETARRRRALVAALDSGQVVATLSAAGRHVGVNHSTVQGWIAKNLDGVADAFARAEGNFRLSGDRPDVPDFAEFRRRYFGSDTPPHQREWFDAIESNDLTLVLVPPNHGKTTAVGIEYVVWRIARDRNVRILYVSKTQGFARKALYQVKRFLSDASWYQAKGLANLVQELGPFRPGQDERSTPWSADLIYVTGIESAEKDPTVEVLGIGNQIYGARADLIVLDDVATIRNQESELEKAKQLDWIVQEVMTRLSPDGKMVIVGTRVREYDVYSTLLDEDVEWARDFAKVVQPAILSDDTKRALWPQERPYDLLVSKYRNRMPARLWNLVYQQAGTGAEDQPFSLETLEAAKDPSYAVGQTQPSFPVAIGVDPAAEGTMAIVVVAFDRSTGARYIIDCLARDKLRHRGAMKAFITETVNRYQATRCVIEKNFANLPEDLDLRVQLAAAGCALQSWKTTTESKYDQTWGVSAIAGQFEQGLWHIPAGPGSEQKMRGLIEELAAWRPGAKVKQDRVMALWFAALAIRGLSSYKPGAPTQRPVPTWVQRRGVPSWVHRDHRYGRVGTA
jgi:hypothetical protein